jgi:hypothetical protein
MITAETAEREEPKYQTLLSCFVFGEIPEASYLG